MLESGLSGSVRGVLSDEHPYRDPRPDADMRSIGEIRFFNRGGLCGRRAAVSPESFLTICAAQHWTKVQ
jgi:hypothetical protein